MTSDPIFRVLRWAAGHGVIEVQRRNVEARIDLVRFSRRTIGRELAARTWRRLRVLRPSLLGIDDETRVDVEGLELPDAVLLHELVLVDRLGPQGARPGRTYHSEIRAARSGTAAVGHHRDDGLQLDVIVDFSLGESSRTERRVQRAANALRADIDTLQADLHRAVGCEQIRHVVPHLAIDVVAV